MKIESLISGDLRIWMTDRELDRWGLGLHQLTTASRTTDRAVRRLLGVARQRIPFCSGGTVTVEALPVEGGMVFVFSAPPRMTIPPAPQVYRLEGAEEVLQLGEAMSRNTDGYPPYASLYQYKQQYYLVVYVASGSNRRHRHLIGEFGTLVAEGDAAVSWMEEHTRPLVVGDALYRLITAYESRQPVPLHPAR